MVTTFHFEEKTAIATLLVLKMESEFICGRSKARKKEGLQHSSSACSLQPRKGLEMYSAWFQTVTELGAHVFPFRSGVEKKKIKMGQRIANLVE